MNRLFPNFNLTTSIKVFAFGNVFLNFEPRKIKISNGKAVPRAYPVTAPSPPHVAADAGPNKIQAPRAEEIKLDVKGNIPIFLFAIK